MPEPLWIYLIALLYFTNMTTCLAIADACDNISHDRLTRRLQGTWSGHIPLDLVLRALFTVAGGYLIVETPWWRNPTRASWVRQPGCGRRRTARSSLGCRWSSSSGRMTSSAFPSPSACGTRGRLQGRLGPGAPELCPPSAQVQATLCPQTARGRSSDLCGQRLTASYEASVVTAIRPSLTALTSAL